MVKYHAHVQLGNHMTGPTGLHRPRGAGEDGFGSCYTYPSYLSHLHCVFFLDRCSRDVGTGKTHLNYRRIFEWRHRLQSGWMRGLNIVARRGSFLNLRDSRWITQNCWVMLALMIGYVGHILTAVARAVSTADNFSWCCCFTFRIFKIYALQADLISIFIRGWQYFWACKRAWLLTSDRKCSHIL